MVKTANSSWIIGLTGPNASGKGVFLEWLQSRGFTPHSLSDAVREEARNLGRTVGREDLILTGREMRKKGGPGIVAKTLLPRLSPPCAVDSIRHPAEVETLRTLPHFRLLGIIAPVEVRFSRICLRKRPGDPQSVKELQEKEREEDGTFEHGQQLSATLALADATVFNDGNLELLFRRGEEILLHWTERR